MQRNPSHAEAQVVPVQVFLYPYDADQLSKPSPAQLRVLLLAMTSLSVALIVYFIWFFAVVLGDEDRKPEEKLQADPGFFIFYNRDCGMILIGGSVAGILVRFLPVKRLLAAQYFFSLVVNAIFCLYVLTAVIHDEKRRPDSLILQNPSLRVLAVVLNVIFMFLHAGFACYVAVLAYMLRYKEIHGVVDL